MKEGRVFLMRKSFTAVLERNATFTSDFATEPYETNWASEALWFLRVLDMSGEDPGLSACPQISPDGLVWCGKPGTEPLVIREIGLYSIVLRDFGHWLRLRCDLKGGTSMVKVLIYLALKE